MYFRDILSELTNNPRFVLLYTMLFDTVLYSSKMRKLGIQSSKLYIRGVCFGALNKTWLTDPEFNEPQLMHILFETFR